MLSTRNLERVREQLDTFLANVRPSPLHRDHFDVSYLLNEFSWVVNVHLQAGETSLLTAHPRLKRFIVKNQKAGRSISLMKMANGLVVLI